MSLPPSCTGLFHEMVTEFLLKLSISGVDGGPGGPVGTKMIGIVGDENVTLPKEQVDA